jgi:hypothetical protein
MENDNYKLNDGHILEATDRLYVTQAYIEGVLVNHPLVDAVPEFLSKIDKVQELLAELYQDVGKYDSINEIKKSHTLTDGYE